MEAVIHRLSHQPLPFNKRREKALSVSLLSDKLVGSEPLTCFASEFERPQLRKCPFDLSAINWTRSHRLGGGLDGYVWKIWLDGRPYAMKMFWDTSPPGPNSCRCYSAQRECQNNALLHLMDAAIKDAGRPPILVNPYPKTKTDALDNTFGFSQQGREDGLQDVDFEPLIISSMPRMRQCYGWAKINKHMFNRDTRPPIMTVDKITRAMTDEEHIAIIYEYIDENENGNDPATVEEVSDFLWRAGFGYTYSSLAKNWINGVLIDLSDIVHASGFGWHPMVYGPRKASQILIS